MTVETRENLDAAALPADPFPDYDLETFLRLEIPPRQWLAEGLIAERGLAMVHAKRGVGKTHFVLGLACAIAAGKPFLRYRVPAPAGVLLVDGEMLTSDLQEHLRLIVKAGTHPEAPLRLLCADLAERTLPSLATSEGQAVIEASSRVDQAPDPRLREHPLSERRGERKQRCRHPILDLEAPPPGLRRPDRPSRWQGRKAERHQHAQERPRPGPPPPAIQRPPAFRGSALRDPSRKKGARSKAA